MLVEIRHLNVASRGADFLCRHASGMRALAIRRYAWNSSLFDYATLTRNLVSLLHSANSAYPVIRSVPQS